MYRHNMDSENMDGNLQKWVAITFLAMMFMFFAFFAYVATMHRHKDFSNVLNAKSVKIECPDRLLIAEFASDGQFTVSLKCQKAQPRLTVIEYANEETLQEDGH